MTQSTWLEMPEPRRVATPNRWRRLVPRAVLPLAVAGVLWLIDLRVASILIAVAATVLVVVGAISPVLSARVEHLMARFGVLVGRVIAIVLLTIVNVLVFAPAALLMWVFGYDPLAPGVRRDELSFWHAHAGRSLPKRQFADERSLWDRVGETRGRRRPILRVATAVGVVTLILAADLAGGWIYDQVSSETHGTPAVADDSFDPTAQPALRDSPWAAQALAEQGALPSVKDSFLGYRLTNKAGVYTNIVDGMRVSYEPPVSGPRVSVWFFGGSALFGDGQRDDHTIPSEFARLAESDGIPVQVRNYGRPGIAMWQELELFEQLVSSGQKPDLVVFYDGFNDLAWQMNVKLSPEPTDIYDPTAGEVANAGTPDTNVPVKQPVSAPSIDAGTSFSDVVDAYWDQSASHHVYDALHDLIGGSDAPKVQFAKGVQQRETSSAPASNESLQAARNAVSIQGRAASLAESIASGVGADASFFWQPNVFTKKLLADEAAYLHLGSYEPERWDPAIREARSRLHTTPFVDLGDALDGATQPVLWDFVHTNEIGARLSAQAIYAHLHARLQQRAGRAR